MVMGGDGGGDGVSVRSPRVSEASEVGAAEERAERAGEEVGAAEERAGEEERAVGARLKAVRTVQRAWKKQFKNKTTAKLIEAYLKEGMSIAKAKGISFQALVIRLKDKGLIQATKGILQRLHMLSTFRHGCDEAETTTAPTPTTALARATARAQATARAHNQEATAQVIAQADAAATAERGAEREVNVRIVLAGFMIAIRPTHVFEAMTQMEQDLMAGALALWEDLERIVAAIHETPTQTFSAIAPELSKDFYRLLMEYLKLFHAWKVPDAAKLTSRITHALMALYQAEAALPVHREGDPPLSEALMNLNSEFVRQILRLREKLEQIGGAAAITAFDARLALVQRGGGMTTMEPLSNAPIETHVIFNEAGGNGRLTNEELAHELFLDPFFQLRENGGGVGGSEGEGGWENRQYFLMRGMFERRFWDSVADDLRLAAGPCFALVLHLLDDVRKGLNDVSGMRERAEVNELIDIEFIRQQAERGLYDVQRCLGLVEEIVRIIQRIQLPARDAQTRTMWEALKREVELVASAASSEAQALAIALAASSEAQALATASSASQASTDLAGIVSKALEFLHDRVNALRVDAANTRLRLIEPVIRQHGVDYERGKLQDKLNNGTHTLQGAKKWISESIKHALEAYRAEVARAEVARAEVNVQAAAAVTVRALRDGNAGAYRSIIQTGMFDLVFGRDGGMAAAANVIPETLLMDRHYLRAMQREALYITQAATLIATAGHGLPSHPQVVSAITELLTDETRRELALDEVLKEISAILDGEQATTIPISTREILLKALKNGVHASDPVMVVMARRVRAFVAGVIQNDQIVAGQAVGTGNGQNIFGGVGQWGQWGSVSPDVRFNTVAALQSRINRLAVRLNHIMSKNLQVHVALYNTLITEAVYHLADPDNA